MLVVGGGVIGLSIAYELARSGRSVRLLERGETGKEASWAGAGILAPGSWYSGHPAMEAAATLSRPLHAEWSRRLQDEVGVDDQHTVSGALYAIGPADLDRLTTTFDRWRGKGIEVRRVGAEQAADVEPAAGVGDAFFVPDEAQVRNPRRLEGLRSACERRGVRFETGSGVTSFDRDGDRIVAALTSDGRFAAGAFCLAAGAWTAGLAEPLGVSVPTRPMRGQIALIRTPRPTLRRIVHADGRYLVPRRDGRVLVGSTVEDVGFNKSTTDAEINELLRFAHRLAPCLEAGVVEAAWAGLRPASRDELPAIGPLPGLANGWVATGHFRLGLQFAPATAVVLRQLLDGAPPALDLSAFSPTRFAAEHAA